MAIRDFLVDRMTVQAPGAASTDASAGPVQSYSPTVTAIPCQFNELSAGQRVTAAMAGMAVTHEILTLYAGVEQGCLVTDEGLGVTVRVTGVQRVRAQGNVETYYVLTGEEVRDGAP